MAALSIYNKPAVRQYRSILRLRLLLDTIMENPKIYREFDKVQKIRISSIIEEFGEDLMNIRGKCMDIGCGPGDITKDFLLPSLDSNAQIIGKRVIN